MLCAGTDNKTVIVVSIFHFFKRTSLEGAYLFLASIEKEIFHGRVSNQPLAIKPRVRRAQGRRWQASLASLETGMAGCGFPKPVLISAGDILREVFPPEINVRKQAAVVTHKTKTVVNKTKRKVSQCLM